MKEAEQQAQIQQVHTEVRRAGLALGVKMPGAAETLSWLAVWAGRVADAAEAAKG